MYALVALWLMPGAIWRPVAGALLISWGIGEGVYAATGNQIPLWVYPFCDALVVAVIFAKRSHWSDLLILPLLGAQWYWYTVPYGREQWTWLYFLTIAQFVVAGPWPNIYRAMNRVSHGPVRALEFR